MDQYTETEHARAMNRLAADIEVMGENESAGDVAEGRTCEGALLIQRARNLPGLAAGDLRLVEIARYLRSEDMPAEVVTSRGPAHVFVDIGAGYSVFTWDQARAAARHARTRIGRA